MEDYYMLMKMEDFEPPQRQIMTLKKEAYCLLILKWYPQANSNRYLHRESIAFVHFLGVIWVKNFTDLTQLTCFFILIL